MRRRQFMKTVVGTATLASVASLRSARALGANERVRVGLVGCGVRGRFVANLMSQVPNVEFVALCDLYEPNLGKAADWAGSRVETCKDFRKLLDRKDVDAVVIATPDHWHAIPTVLACEAGKDVYVEKPAGHNVREGQAMVASARRNNRIVQIGHQQRSAPHFEQIREIIASGELGKVHFVRIWNYMNRYPKGLGKKADEPAPEGVDWDFYLGPAPWVPFNRNRFVGTYRWFFDYAGGIMTDFGSHRIDSMHQVMGVDAPAVISASGSRFAIDDGADTPDVLQVTFDYPGFVVSYEACALNAHGVGGRTPGRKYYRALGTDDRPNGLAFYGTNGALFADRIGFEIYPELAPRDDSEISTAPRSHRMKRKEAAAEDATALHVKDFIDCVRSRKKPKADIEIGHKSSNACHLGNIAYRTGRKLRWDAGKEAIVDDAEAAKLLSREARRPWDLI